MLLAPRFSKSAQSFGRTAAPAVGFKARRWRESSKHNPADAHDARPPGSLNPPNQLVELLRLLWLPRPDDRRESFQVNPADAHDARPPVL